MPNELKPEDVMRENDFLVRGLSQEQLAAEREQALREGYEALLRDKDDKIERYILQIAEMQKQIATQDRILTDFMKYKKIEDDKDADIERLNAEIGRLGEQCRVFAIEYPKITRAEAITEFAERIKKFYSNLKGKTASGSVEYHIEQIAKEMKGGDRNDQSRMESDI